MSRIFRNSFLWGVVILFGSLGAVKAITPVEIVNPEFPEELLLEGTEGNAIVIVAIKPDGNVEGGEVVEATRPEFGEAALEAVLAWKFEPFDEAMGVRRVRIPFDFKLPFHHRMNVYFGREVYRDMVPDRQVLSPEVFTEDTRPRPVRRAVPRYPRSLVGTGKTGRVRVEYFVDENGKTINPTILDSDKVEQEFIIPTLMAVIMTEWRPVYLRMNEPVYLKVRDTFDFHEGMDDDHPEEKEEEKKPRRRWFGGRGGSTE